MTNKTSGDVTIDQIGKFDMIWDNYQEANGWVPLLGGKIYKRLDNGTYKLLKFSDTEKSEICPRIIYTIIHVIKNIFSFILFPWLICVYKKRDAARALVGQGVLVSDAKLNSTSVRPLISGRHGAMEDPRVRMSRSERIRHAMGSADTSTPSQVEQEAGDLTDAAASPKASVKAEKRKEMLTNFRAQWNQNHPGPVARVDAAATALVCELHPQTRVQHALQQDSPFVYITAVHTSVKKGLGVYNVRAPEKRKGGAIELAEEMFREMRNQNIRGLVSIGIAGNAMRPAGGLMKPIMKSDFSAMGRDPSLHGQEESIYNVAFTAQATLVLTMSPADQTDEIKRLLAAAVINNPKCKDYPFYKHFSQSMYFKGDSVENITRMIQLLFAASIQGVYSEVDKATTCKKMRFGFPGQTSSFDFANPSAEHYTQCVSHRSVLPYLNAQDGDNLSRLSAARSLDGKNPTAFPVNIINGHGPNTVNDPRYPSMVKSFDSAAASCYDNFKRAIKNAVIGQLVRAMADRSQYVVLPMISTNIYCKQDWKAIIVKDFRGIVNEALETQLKFVDNSTAVLGEYFNKVVIGDIEFDANHNTYSKRKAIRESFEKAPRDKKNSKWHKFAKDTWVKEMQATIANRV